MFAFWRVLITTDVGIVPVTQGPGAGGGGDLRNALIILGYVSGGKKFAAIVRAASLQPNVKLLFWVDTGLRLWQSLFQNTRPL